MRTGKVEEINYFGEIVRVYGPYKSHEGERRIVRLIFPNGSSKTMLVARLTLELKLSRKLKYNETVDHIDGNPLNDDESNLQLLTRADNIRKDRKPKKMLDFICPECNIAFSREARYVIKILKEHKRGPYCSKRCAGIASHH